ncbi:nuclear transport factor 2 family protein [Actinomadura rupiterrae]|uniref:nuclear transport factor 2 family protein n=1 Tax=Actinomadura rupiterrae TaxID=559627 RepID=UPI0020A606A5|nr:nuclear transport factor 2 family protein [Actinomadura rupiterrae]MCP2340142.1 hypothetical protein [Actinomadura rupiterrae]
MGIRSEHDLSEFLVTYTRDMVSPDTDPGEVLDRFFTPDFEFRADGLVIDRDRMMAHVKPMRKRVASSDQVSLDVHEALVSGDRISARYTLRAALPKGPDFAGEIYMFGHLAEDGRIRRIDQTTRDLAEKP